jgi:hypothetical protein
MVVKLESPTCLSGKVVDSNGNPVQGASVTGYYQGGYGRTSKSATTGPMGEYCLPVPKQASVKVSVSIVENGTFKAASATVTAGGSAQACGGGSCTSVPDLTPKTGQTACISTDVLVEDGMNGPRGAAAGTHVYAFATQGDSAGVEVDCSKAPSEWGTLVGQTTTDSSGSFCVSAPANAQTITLVAGKCSSGGSQAKRCLNQRPVSGLSAGASCGSGNCKQLVEGMYIARCGEGP